MFQVQCDIPEDLESKFATSLSTIKLTERTVLIAQQAGVMLLAAAVQNCIDAVYGATSETTDVEHEYERTLALLESHILEDQGLDQIVLIDPSAEAVDPHSGRELVIDYAVPVHEGYTQFFMGKDTGRFVVGKFWFEATIAEKSVILASFISAAYEELMMECLEEIF